MDKENEHADRRTGGPTDGRDEPLVYLYADLEKHIELRYSKYSFHQCFTNK